MPGNEENKIDFIANLKNYFELARPYWAYFLVIALFVLLASLSIVGEKYLFKIILDNGASFVSGTLEKNALIQILLGVVVAYAIVVAVKGVSNWARYYFLNRLDGRLILDLKKKYFDYLVRLSHKFHTTNRTGTLIARMTRGARSIEGITDFIVFSSIPLVIQLSVVFVALLYFDVFSAITIIVIMFVFILFVLFVTQKQQKPKIESNEADDAEKGLISDVFTNIDTVKYYGKEDRIGSVFLKLAQTSTKKFIINWDYESYVEVGQSIIFGIGVAFLLYFPLVKFLNGELSIGDLAFVYTIYANVAEPMYAFMFGIRRFYEAMADFQSLIQYDKVKNDVADKPNAKEMRVKKGKIEFRDISFTYHKKKVISEFSLSINPNEKVAFVGYSGSGKTTLIKLLYRLYDVDSGSIFIDGKNINEVKQESLRSELSIVPQEGIMFNDTILNNVAFSKDNASKSEVMNALKAAQLDEFVQSLPEKENTYVGERGIKLSGGERQRLSIARAVLANKKILILDEATSSLDSVTESQIQKALLNLMKGRTTIVIAHRLSTILSADKIVVLSKGKIVAIGKHNDLIKQDGLYKKLWNMQKGGYIE